MSAAETERSVIISLSRSERAARLARLRRIAWLVDAAFHLPGTRFRFGLNSILGLTPVAGDSLLACISLYIIWEAYCLGLRGRDIARMLLNVAIETGAGAIPLIGDLLDVAFKANLRNLAIIERRLKFE